MQCCLAWTTRRTNSRMSVASAGSVSSSLKIASTTLLDVIPETLGATSGENRCLISCQSVKGVIRDDICHESVIWSVKGVVEKSQYVHGILVLTHLRHLLPGPITWQRFSPSLS